MKAWALNTCLVVALLTIACTDSGGGFVIQTQTQQPTIVSFGLVRGDQPTTRTVNLTKPFVPAGQAELAETPVGAFAPAPNALPVSVGVGVDFAFQVTFTPPPGPPPAAPVTGTITVRFTNAGGADLRVEILLSATVESPDIRLASTTVDFGKVAVGETADAIVVVHNPSASTPVTVTGVTGLGGAFQLGPGNLFPLILVPASSFPIVVSYTPAAVGSDTSAIAVDNSVKAPLLGSIKG